MRKEDFKMVRGIAMIGNTTLATFLSVFVALVAWLIKKDESIFIFFLGLIGLFVICAMLNIYTARKLRAIEFEGTAKKLAQDAEKQAMWVLAPFVYAITINRIRQAMWDWYIEQKTGHIEDPVERAKINRALIEELNADGFITQRQYENKVAKYPEDLAAAKAFKKELDEAEKLRKQQEKNNKKKDSSSDDGWI